MTVLSTRWRYNCIKRWILFSKNLSKIRETLFTFNLCLQFQLFVYICQLILFLLADFQLFVYNLNFRAKIEVFFSFWRYFQRKYKINLTASRGNFTLHVNWNWSSLIGKNIVLDGLMLVDKKGGRRLAKMVNSYIEAQDSAKRNHLNIWEYGDITGEEAREFGAPPPKA